MLQLGLPVLLHLNPMSREGQRLPSHIRGWHKPHHILVDMPVENAAYASLQKGQSCIIRFLAEGRACGFSSQILDWDKQGALRYCRIAWPQQTQCIAFRKHERIDLFVPCTIHKGEDAWPGEIADLSIGGCRVLSSGIIEPDTELMLDFTLPDGLPMMHVKAIVRKVRFSHGKTVLGCEFAPDQECLQSDMAFFILGRLPRHDEERAARQRVLIIGDNPEMVRPLRAAFDGADWEVYTTDSTMEGLMRLRMVAPSALLVAFGMKDLGARNLISLIRATRGFEALPVFVFGGEISESETLLSGLTGTRHLPLPLECKRVVSQVRECLPRRQAGSAERRG